MSDDNFKNLRRPRKKDGRVINMLGSDEFFIRKGDELSEAGDFLGALRMYRRAAATDEEDAELKLLIADTLLDMNCFVEASGVLASMLVEDDPVARHAIFRFAHCMLGRGELMAAKELFTLSLAGEAEDDPSTILGFEDAANAFECIEYCERCLEDGEADKRALRDIDEISVDDAINKAGSLSEMGDFEGAIPLLREALIEHPRSVELFTDLLLDLYFSRQLDEGRKLYENASGRFKRDMTALCGAAMIYHGLDMREEEAQCVREILGRDISDTNELVRAYTVLMELSRFDEALEYADRLVKLDPYNRNFNHFLAHAAYETGDAALAKRLYLQNLVIEPHDSTASYYVELCNTLLDGGDKGVIQVDYSIPPTEYVRRMERTGELAKLTSEELKAVWDEDRDEILRLVDWAMNDRTCPFGDLFLVMLSALDKREAETLARRLLVEPDCSDEMRKLAAARLNALCANRKFLMYQRGGVSVCSFGPSAPQYADWPESYKKIIRLVHSELGETEPQLFAAAARLCYLYVLDNYKTRPTLPYGQAEAMAAAIVFFVLTHSEMETKPEINSFAAAHGVTVRRMENAMQRLLAVTVPDELAAKSEENAADIPSEDDDE